MRGKNLLPTLQAALDLASEVRQLGLGTGCVQVSLRALGASAIEIGDVIDHAEKERVWALENYLARQGMETVIAAIVTPGLEAAEVRSFIEHPAVAVRETQSDVVIIPSPIGFLGLFNNDPDGDHMLAVVHPRVLPRDVRRSNPNAALVVDTSWSATLGFMPYPQLAEHLLEPVNRGATVILAAIALIHPRRK